MNMILYALYIAVLFGLAVVVHELGHMLAFKIFANKTVRLQFSFRDGLKVGHRIDYIGLSKMQYYLIMMIGIVAGIIPLFAIGDSQIFMIAVFIYLFSGSRSDIYNMMRVMMGKRT